MASNQGTGKNNTALVIVLSIFGIVVLSVSLIAGIIYLQKLNKEKDEAEKQKIKEEVQKRSKEKSEQERQSVINPVVNLLNEWKKGNTGEPYCRKECDRLYTPTVWEVVNVEGGNMYSGNTQNGAFGTVKAIVSSSTKGGIQIKKRWKFWINEGVVQRIEDDEAGK